MNTKAKRKYPFTLPTTEYPNFHERLCYTMTLRNCSVADLADALYISKSAVCGYRTGHRHPDLRTLKLICQTLHVSADFLLGLEEEIYL